jgi:DNA-binding transcriptional LysR family regulator
MDYTLRELECFTAVAEELSFTRAARRLHLAQPPLSRHIRVLEEKMGVRLFERDQHGVSLTTAGGRFYEETRGILPQLSRAGEAVRRAARGETSRLRLGFVSAVLSAELVGTFRKFRAAHSQVQVMLHDSPPAEQLQSIAEGRLDGGFVGLMPEYHPAGVKFVPWRQ